PTPVSNKGGRRSASRAPITCATDVRGRCRPSPNPGKLQPFSHEWARKPKVPQGRGGLLAGRGPSAVLLSEAPCLQLRRGTMPQQRWFPSARARCMMALFEDLALGSVTSSALIGLGLVVAAPVLVPVVGAVVRPVVRLALQGGLAAYDAAATLVTTAGEAV